MHKILFTLCICLTVGIFARPVVAGTCEGGSEITAQDNHQFCVSSASMTWWAAFAWCKRQGRELATLQQACDDWYGATGDSACPNLVVGTDKYVWTANPYGASNAYNVNLSSGNINNNNRNNNNYALCY